jgi:hypothetical protein
MQQDSCAQALTLPSAEYQAARAQARPFLIAVTTNLEIGRVVSQNGTFAVVETASETHPESPSRPNRGTSDPLAVPVGLSGPVTNRLDSRPRHRP